MCPSNVLVFCHVDFFFPLLQKYKKMSLKKKKKQKWTKIA